MDEPILDYRPPEKKPPIAISLWLAIAANLGMAAYALKYLFDPVGQGFTQFPGFDSMSLSFLAFMIVLSVGVRDVFERKRIAAGIAAIVLGMMPFATFLAVFSVIAYFKKFRFY
jgi:hypothetical protein